MPQETLDVVHYYGKKIVYFPPEEKVILLCSAWVRYKDLAIFSDTIVYDLEKEILSAYKGVNFTSATESISGREFHYNVRTGRGMMKSARTRTAEGLLYGEVVYLLKEKTLLAEDCYYTTCDRSHPHYQFYGRRLKVLLDDMAIAQPVVLEFSSVPVAAAPFWFFPVAERRKSGLLPFKVGQSSQEGYYARGISYYWVVNDYSDLTFYLDVMQKRGLRPRLEGIYLCRPFAEGNFLLSYIDEWDTKIRRYSVNGKHSSVFFGGSDLAAYVDFASDAKYLPDYAEERIEWLKQEMRSEASLSRRIRRVGKVSLNFRHFRDFPRDITIFLLPSFTFSLTQRPLFSGFGFAPSLSFARERKIDRDTTGRDSLSFTEERVQVSLGFYLPPFPWGSISLSNNLGGGQKSEKVLGAFAEKARYLTFNTGLAINHSLPEGIYLSENFDYYHRLDFRHDSTLPGANFNFSLSSGLNLYRPYSLSLFTLRGFLHTFSPSISYSFTPQIKIRGIWGIPRFDTLPLNHTIGVRLGNNFQGKFGKEEFVGNIGSVNLSLSYNLIEKRLTPLNLSSEVILLSQPSAYSVLNLSFFIPLDSLRLRGLSLQTNTSLSYQISCYPSFLSFLEGDTIDKKIPFRFSLVHSYAFPENNMLNYTVGFAPREWEFSLTGGYNIKKRERTDYAIGIWRDLHCWEAIANISGFGKNWRYDFRIRIKKLPDVAIGKGIFEFLLP